MRHPAIPAIPVTPAINPAIPAISAINPSMATIIFAFTGYLHWFPSFYGWLYSSGYNKYTLGTLGALEYKFWKDSNR